MLFSKKKSLGLDIGSSSIKIAELDVNRRDSTLVNFGMAPTPPGATSSGDIVDPLPIAEAIKKLASEMKTKRKLAAASLWGNSVVVKRITIPRMEEKMVAEQIRWEAEQYIPYDINQVNLDFSVLKSSSSEETMDVLLIAAVKDAVLKCVETVELSGFQCSVLDVEGFALASCFTHNYGSAPGTVAVLNLGAFITNCVIMDNGEVVFSRDIPVGGTTYNQEVQKGLNVSPEEAEALKISISRKQAAPSEAADILQGTHEIICDEVSSCFEFFLNTTSAGSVDQVYLTGGCTRVPGLLDALSKRFPCNNFDPFLRVKLGRQFAPAYVDRIRDFAAIAVGLGLRSGDV